MDKNSGNVSFRQQKAEGVAEKAKYILRLYVTGVTPRSIRAIENLKRICKDYVEDQYQLEVIDIYQQPELAKRDQIVAAPTLIKQLPFPLRRFIGDLSDAQGLLSGLDLEKKRE